MQAAQASYLNEAVKEREAAEKNVESLRTILRTRHQKEPAQFDSDAVLLIGSLTSMPLPDAKYKAMCLLFHPDKWPDGDEKEAGERLFKQVKKKV